MVLNGGVAMVMAATDCSAPPPSFSLHTAHFQDYTWECNTFLLLSHSMCPVLTPQNILITACFTVNYPSLTHTHAHTLHKVGGPLLDRSLKIYD